MLTNNQLKDHMRLAFCGELDFGATCIFNELTPEEQDHIIGIGDDQEWGDLDDASYRGGQYNDELTDDQKTTAVRRYFEAGGVGGVYAKFLPADTVEFYHLHDIIKARGWVRHTGEHIDGYYPPEAIERMKLEEEQDRIDARDLEIGRNFGATLSRIEKTAVETNQGVGVLVDHLPDAKKPTVISWDEAVAIMKRKGGDPTWSARTARNWIKAGKAAKTGTPISWNDLATVASWSAWVDAYLAAYKTRVLSKNFISERKAQAEAADKRRRGIRS